jgi:hypothetical protein
VKSDDFILTSKLVGSGKSGVESLALWSIQIIGPLADCPLRPPLLYAATPRNNDAPSRLQSRRQTLLIDAEASKVELRELLEVAPLTETRAHVFPLLSLYFVLAFIIPSAQRQGGRRHVKAGRSENWLDMVYRRMRFWLLLRSSASW